MTRTTIDLDPSVVRELKRRGKLEGKSMGQVASEALARALSRQGTPDLPPFRWTSGNLGAPKVDLDDREALLAILDEPS